MQIPNGINVFAHACCAIWPVSSSRADGDANVLYISGISSPVFSSDQLIVEHMSGMDAQAQRFVDRLAIMGYSVIEIVEEGHHDLGGVD